MLFDVMIAVVRLSLWIFYLLLLFGVVLLRYIVGLGLVHILPLQKHL